MVDADQVMVLPTPFHPRTAAACGTGHWKSWSGYRVVDEYTRFDLEYFAVRNQCGVFDMSPMVKYEISGTQAVDFLNRLVTRDVRKLGDNHVAYVLFCNERGHILDDGTLFRYSDTRFRLFTQDRHLPWLLDSAAGFEVGIRDVTDELAALAVQGPTSCAVLKRLGLGNIEHLAPFAFRTFEQRHDLVVSRTGFTGDLGYELWINPDHALDLWDALQEAGRDHGLVPYGSRALEMLRIEAGYLMPHIDFLPAGHLLRPNRGRSPFDLGFDRLVEFEKGFFNGRRALQQESVKGPRFRLVGLEVEGNKPATDAWIYQGRKKKVGHVTSAMWSPSCKRNIALALLETGVNPKTLWADIYLRKELKWTRLPARCWPVSRAFFKPRRNRAVPAGEY